MDYFYSYTGFIASSLRHADIINLNTELFLYRKTERKSLLQEPSSSLRELHRQYTGLNKGHGVQHFNAGQRRWGSSGGDGGGWGWAREVGEEH